MSISDFRRMSEDELRDRLLELKKEWFNLRFQRASGQLENTARFRVLRRDIARILTICSERQRTSTQTSAQSESV